MANDYEPKYRKFRWTVEMPGIEPFIVKRIEMLNGHRWTVDFHYVNDMEIGKCPVPFRSPSAAKEEERGFHEIVLKILDETGNVVRQARANFVVEDYVPALELDYGSSDYALGRVVLWVLSPAVWS